MHISKAEHSSPGPTDQNLTRRANATRQHRRICFPADLPHQDGQVMNDVSVSEKVRHCLTCPEHGVLAAALGMQGLLADAVTDQYS